MPIEFNCQKCQKLLRVPDGSAGKKAQCPSCQTVLEIPLATPPGSDPFAAPEEPSGELSAPLPSAEGTNPEGASPFASQSAPPAAPLSENPFASPMAPTSAGGGYASFQGSTTHDAVLAPRLHRFAGAILDGLISLVGIIPFFISIAIGIALEGGGDPDTVDFALFGGLACSGFAVLAINIYQWYLISTTGQSIAKRLLRMRIVKVDNGALPGFVNGVLLRIFVPGMIGFIPYIGSFFGIVDALFIFGEERRCIHDHIAGTIVIEVQKSETFSH